MTSSRSIALLSGKGGSGKTTLAIQMADVLSKCELRVLLVDCDMMTNGATYFYESKLEDGYSSLFDLLYADPEPDPVNERQEERNPRPFRPMPIRKPGKNQTTYDFLPSVRKIKNMVGKMSLLYDENRDREFKKLYQGWRQAYDVILFDCQAGFSEVLRYIVPLADVKLLISERDKISMAAMRGLYLKMDSLFGEIKIVLVFNKVRPEEKVDCSQEWKNYYRILTGIQEDKELRDAFFEGDAPYTDPINRECGLDLGVKMRLILDDLFPEAKFQQKLLRYSKKVSLEEAKREYLPDAEFKKERRKTVTLSIIPIVVEFLFVAASYFSGVLVWGDYLDKALFAIITIIFIWQLSSFCLAMQRSYNIQRERRKQYEKALEDIEKRR